MKVDETSTSRRRRGCLRLGILEPTCYLDLWPPKSNRIIVRG